MHMHDHARYPHSWGRRLYKQGPGASTAQTVHFCVNFIKQMFLMVRQAFAAGLDIAASWDLAAGLKNILGKAGYPCQ